MINPLRVLESSNIWEQPKQIKIAFVKKLEQIEVRECLVSFVTESFVFHCAVQKCKY